MRRSVLLFTAALFATAALGVSAFAQTNPPTVFTTNLWLGSSGIQVGTLQHTLNLDPETRVADTGPGSPGGETSYFGSLTKAAVIRFQDKYASDVLSPIGLTSGTGYVGLMTREKLNNIIAGVPSYVATSSNRASSGTQTQSTSAQASSSGAPLITSISPTSGKNDAEITITGLGFTPTGNTVKTTLAVFNNIPSSDGKTIAFTFYSNTVNTLLDVGALKQSGVTAADLEAQIQAERQSNPQNALPAGASLSFPLAIAVTNGNGTSNIVHFGLDMNPVDYLDATSTATNSNRGSSLLGMVTHFLESISFVHSAEASCDWNCWYNHYQDVANGQWNNMVSKGGSSVGTGPAFGGNIVWTLPCICSASTAFVIRPVSGSFGPYDVPWYDGALKAYYDLLPGNWALGSAPVSSVCSMYVGIACYNFNAKEITPMPGVGTSAI
ncbi:MAG: peptidoglycan-binding protein [Patescibacteria group bacterium]|nr:peptidoglycan-binding protein [Patescibacteria group bacterium]